LSANREVKEASSPNSIQENNYIKYMQINQELKKKKLYAFIFPQQTQFNIFISDLKKK